MIETWNDLKELANELLANKNLSSEYSDRLLYEIEEIEKQAAGGYWLDLFNNKKRFEHNKSGLVIAWALKLTKVDPIKGEKKIYASGNKKINGIEIILENGMIINTSMHTLINTSRGYVKACDIIQQDEII